MNDNKPTMESMTFIDFNPSDSPEVREIKAKADELIALIVENTGATPQSKRRSAIAVTHVETGAMFAVKALFS